TPEPICSRTQQREKTTNRLPQRGDEPMKPIDNININVNLNVQPLDVPTVAGPAGQAAAPGRIPENVLHGLEKAMQMFGASRATGQYNKLQDAEELVKDAFSRIQGPHVSPANRLLAQTEMERASQIRQ